MTEEQLKKLHTAMQYDNEHQCNSLNNYIHTDEYLTAGVVQVVEEIVAEETKELEKQIEKMKCCENCKHHGYMGNELICHLSTIEEEDDCMKSKKYWEWWRNGSNQAN